MIFSSLLALVVNVIIMDSLKFVMMCPFITLKLLILFRTHNFKCIINVR